MRWVDFLEKSAGPACCESPLKLQRHLVQLLAIRKQIATAHKALSAAFYLLHTAVGNGAMNKFLIYSQWRRKVFTIRMLFLCRRHSSERSKILATAECFIRDVGKCAMMPVAMLRPVGID